MIRIFLALLALQTAPPPRPDAVPESPPAQDALPEGTNGWTFHRTSTGCWIDRDGPVTDSRVRAELMASNAVGKRPARLTVSGLVALPPSVSATYVLPVSYTNLGGTNPVRQITTSGTQISLPASASDDSDAVILFPDRIVIGTDRPLTIDLPAFYRMTNRLKWCEEQRLRIDPGSNQPPVTQPKPDPSSFVGVEDYYPASARRAGDTGVTSVAVTVSARGQVSECRITTSSGSDDLDDATCLVMHRRARFTPAVDSAGQPTQALFRMRLRWSL